MPHIQLHYRGCFTCQPTSVCAAAMPCVHHCREDGSRHLGWGFSHVCPCPHPATPWDCSTSICPIVFPFMPGDASPDLVVATEHKGTSLCSACCQHLSTCPGWEHCPSCVGAVRVLCGWGDPRVSREEHELSSWWFMRNTFIGSCSWSITPSR